MFNEEKYKRDIKNLENDEIYEYLLNHVKNPYNFPQLKEIFTKQVDLVNLQNSKGQYLITTLTDEYINMSFERTDDFIIRNYEKIIDVIFKHPDFNIPAYDINQIHLNAQNNIIKVNTVAGYDDEDKKRVKFNLNELISNIYDKQKTANDLAYKYDIEKEFDQNILDEVDEYLDVDNELYRDLTKEYIITIDNHDTNLYDDAIGFKILPNGNYQLRLCITDAAKFAPLKSKINHEAFRRAEKIYFNKYHFANQMLPDKLSNEYCSLQAGKNRYAVSFNYEFTDKLKLVDFHAERAIINIHKNLSYEQATGHLLNPKKNNKESDTINDLLIFANKLKKSDNFRYIKEKEYTKDFKVKPNSTEAVHAIVQLFATLTNHQIGNFFSDKNLLIIYYTCKEKATPPILRDPKVNESEALSNIVKKGEITYLAPLYSTRRIGFYPQNLQNYAPVTSPARKYADLFNLEMVKHYMIDKIPYEGNRGIDKRYINDICKSLNERMQDNKKYVEESYSHKANPLKEEIKNKVDKNRKNKNNKIKQVDKKIKQ